MEILIDLVQFLSKYANLLLNFMVNSLKYSRIDKLFFPQSVISLSKVYIFVGVFISSGSLNIFMLNLLGFFCGRVSFDYITMGFLYFQAPYPYSSGGKSFFLLLRFFYDFLTTAISSLSSSPNPYNLPPANLSYCEFIRLFLPFGDLLLVDYLLITFVWCSDAYYFGSSLICDGLIRVRTYSSLNIFNLVSGFFQMTLWK